MSNVTKKHFKHFKHSVNKIDHSLQNRLFNLFPSTNSLIQAPFVPSMYHSNQGPFVYCQLHFTYPLNQSPFVYSQFPTTYPQNQLLYVQNIPPKITSNVVHDIPSNVVHDVSNVVHDIPSNVVHDVPSKVVLNCSFKLPSFLNSINSHFVVSINGIEVPIAEFFKFKENGFNYIGPDFIGSTKDILIQTIVAILHIQHSDDFITDDSILKVANEFYKLFSNLYYHGSIEKYNKNNYAHCIIDKRNKKIVKEIEPFPVGREIFIALYEDLYYKFMIHHTFINKRYPRGINKRNPHGFIFRIDSVDKLFGIFGSKDNFLSLIHNSYIHNIL